MRAAQHDSWCALAGMIACNAGVLQGCADMLHCAAEEGAFRTTQLLLHCGVDPNETGSVRLMYYNCQPKGRLPIQSAATTGNLEIIELLVAGRANPNGQDSDGGTAMMTCGGSDKHVEAMQLLLKCQVDPNMLRMDGAHALHVAAYVR